MKKYIIEALLNIYRLFYKKSTRLYLKNNTLLIILYHQIEKELLEKHFQYLIGANYRFVSINEVIEFYSKRDYNFPGNSIFINFDDGFKSNFDLLSVFTKYQVRPAIFLPVGLVNTNRKIWTSIFDKGDKVDMKLFSYLQKISNLEKDKILLETKNYYLAKEWDERQILNIHEIRQMCSYVDFQSHGMYHPIFTKCSQKELIFELNESKRILENMIGKACNAIAYPNGKFDSREIEEALRAGYIVGREAMIKGLNHKGSNPMALKRVTAKREATVNDLKKEILKAELLYLKEIHLKNLKINF